MFPGTVTRLSERRTASATTIIADADIIVLTGTTTIETIQAKASPFSKAGQVVFLLAQDGTVVLGVTGNIAVAASIPQDRYVPLIYSFNTAKWHPAIVV